MNTTATLTETSMCLVPLIMSIPEGAHEIIMKSSKLSKNRRGICAKANGNKTASSDQSRGQEKRKTENQQRGNNVGELPEIHE